MSVIPLLGLVFVTLKLTNVIDWSWWWVTSPFWAPITAGVAIYVIALLIDGITHLFSTQKQRDARKAKQEIQAFINAIGKRK